MVIRVCAVLLALLLVAAPVLQVRCQLDEDVAATEVIEGSDVGIVGDDTQVFSDVGLGPAPGVDTVCVFPKNAGKLVPAGEEAELLVGLHNDVESPLNMVAIHASLHLPFDHRMLVQNLTMQEFHNASVPVSAQATFPYLFSVSKYLQPGSFDLVARIDYEIDQQPYQNVFYNGTIEVVEAGGFLTIESVFLVTLGVALLVFLGLWAYGQIQQFSKILNLKMEEDSSFPRGGGMSLLEQFEGILEGDKLIDEIGFLGPSQFASLDQDLSGSSLNQCTPIQLADVSLENNITELNTVQYDKNFFWNRNNKLAISTDVLSHLYIAARHAYIDASRRYKASINLTTKKGVFCSASAQPNFDHLLEYEILKHTKALLILSCNFGSAWNDRKLVLLRKHEMALFLEELRFSSLILSGASKVEYAWSQRRWVIKTVGDYLQDLPGIIREESDLVEKIAEKSKMNYRAWGHRCWLISYMNSDQVFHELAKSKKWTALHVADNCCFHYRRELMLNLLKVYNEASTNCNFDVCLLYKEELKWTELLIRRYIGREALWIHRRFLTQCWIKHFTTNQGAAVTESEDLISSTTQTFLAKELQFARSFLNIANGFYDTHDQAQHAASYILWTLKFALPLESMHEEILSELRGLKPLLLKTCSVNSLGWETMLL